MLCGAYGVRGAALKPVDLTEYRKQSGSKARPVVAGAEARIYIQGPPSGET